MLALFNKAIRKFHGQLRASKEAAVGRTLPVARPDAAARNAPHAVGVDEDLDEAAAAVRAEMRGRFSAEELARYAVTGARLRAPPPPHPPRAPLHPLSPALFAPYRVRPGSRLPPPAAPAAAAVGAAAADAPINPLPFLQTPRRRQAWTRSTRRRSTPRRSPPAAS